MPSLARLFLIPAALSLSSTATIAKDIPGLPKALIGTFALSPERCQEEALIEEFFEENGKSFYGICGRNCRYPVLSHRRTKNGYALNVYFESPIFGDRTERLYVTKLGGNKLRLRFSGNRSYDFVACDRA
jgi:hypothetical protein